MQFGKIGRSLTQNPTFIDKRASIAIMNIWMNAFSFGKLDMLLWTLLPPTLFATKFFQLTMYFVLYTSLFRLKLILYLNNCPTRIPSNILPQPPKPSQHRANLCPDLTGQYNSVTRRRRCFHIMFVYYHNFNLTWNLNRGVAGTSRIYSRFYNKLYDYANNNNGEEVCGCAATRPSSESLLHEWLCSFRWNGDGIRGRNLYSLLGKMVLGILRWDWMFVTTRMGGWEHLRGRRTFLAPELENTK